MNKTRLIQFALLSATSQAWALPAYTITDLGTLGGSLSAAMDINARGEVVGRSYTASGLTHAFLYSNGLMNDLGAAGGSSYSEGINDHGQIVGSSGSRAFLYDNGVMTEIGTLGGSSSSAQSINNAGQIVGYSDTGRGYNRAFSYANGVMTDIGTLGGANSAAFDINASGQIVGGSSTAASAGHSHAFLYDNGTMTDLGTLGGGRSDARGVNNVGQIVGQAWTAQGNGRAFLYTNGIMMDLGTLGGNENASYSYATSINNRGQVVGTSWTNGSDPHAFLFDDDQMIDLNSLVAAGARWTSLIEVVINDAGQIAGVGINHGLRHAFIMSPVLIPEPASAFLISLGLAVLGIGQWSKKRLPMRV